VRDIAYEVRERMQENESLSAVNLDWNEQARAVRLEIDQDRARALGLTPEDVARSLQMLLTGTTVTTVRDGIELVDVVARAVPEERLDLERLGDLTVATRNGRAVSISQIARIVYGHEEPILWRANRDMQITVRGDVVAGVQPPDASAAVWASLADLRDRLPIGYRLEVGGAAEESGRANAALGQVYPVMILVMLVLLMIQLQSFSQMALVLATAPLGLIGATVALLAFGRPFGFVALLGVIALAGMVMRNTVILVDQIGRERAAGMAPFDAVVAATVRRARPVVLTALAAVLAMIPLSGNLFWGPMAVAIMGGLVVATVLTLTFVPALYALWFRVKVPAGAVPVKGILASPATQPAGSEPNPASFEPAEAVR
jgi:multidrug efflux pump subunit AcrB